jgi:hypothetical protein
MLAFLLALLLLVGCVPGLSDPAGPSPDAPLVLHALDVGQPTFLIRCTGRSA